MYSADTAAKPGIIDVIIAKHRNGGVGTVKLKFNKQYSNFSNLSADAEAQSLEKSMPASRQTAGAKADADIKAPEDIVPMADSGLADNIFK